MGACGAIPKNATAGPRLEVEVVSDVICPWCYVGKRQLELALVKFRQAHPDAEVVVRWRPFQLNPAMSPEGMDRADYLTRRFGTVDVSERYKPVIRAGAEVGLSLNIDQIKRLPNTLIPHALIGALEGQAGDAVETFFKAYFVEGRDLSDAAVLGELAQSAGLSAQATQTVLKDESLHQAVSEQDMESRELGISGVPFFIFNRKLAVNGAQGPARLLEAMTDAL